MAYGPAWTPVRWWNVGVASIAAALVLGALAVAGILAFIGIAAIAYHGPVPVGTRELLGFSIVACAASAVLILGGLGAALFGLRGGAWEDSVSRFTGAVRTLGWVLVGLPFGAFALGLVLLAQAVVLQGAADPSSGSALASALGWAFFVSQLLSMAGLLTVPAGGWILLRRVPRRPA